MQVIRSLVFYIFLTLWTIFVFLLGFFGYVANARGFVDKWGRRWSKVNTRAMSLICGVKVNIRGEENIPKGSFIIASKHESAWETFFLCGYFDKSVFVVKEQLAKIPCFGYYLRMMGFILIDRAGGIKALKSMVRQSVEALKSGGRVVVFPEGTRVQHGDKPRLKGGVVEIYKQVPGTKILPVFLDSGRVWPRKSLIIRPGEINVCFKKSVQGDFHGTQLLDKIHESINSPTNK